MTDETMNLIVELDGNIKEWNEESEELINALSEAQRKQLYKSVESMKKTKKIADDLIMELWATGIVERRKWGRNATDFKVIKGGKEKGDN